MCRLKVVIAHDVLLLVVVLLLGLHHLLIAGCIVTALRLSLLHALDRGPDLIYFDTDAEAFFCILPPHGKSRLITARAGTGEIWVWRTLHEGSLLHASCWILGCRYLADIVEIRTANIMISEIVIHCYFWTGHKVVIVTYAWAWMNAGHLTRANNFFLALIDINDCSIIMCWTHIEHHIVWGVAWLSLSVVCCLLAARSGIMLRCNQTVIFLVIDIILVITTVDSEAATSFDHLHKGEYACDTFMLWKQVVAGLKIPDRWVKQAWHRLLKAGLSSLVRHRGSSCNNVESWHFIQVLCFGKWPLVQLLQRLWVLIDEVDLKAWQNLFSLGKRVRIREFR